MSDLKFNIDGKDISSDEIKSGKKDFNTFYNDYASKTKPFYQKGWFWGGAGLASLAIMATVLFNNNTTVVAEAKQNNTIISNATNVSVSAQKTDILPFVNPPIDGINVPWEKMLVDAAKGGIVINKRGSKLSFPKMAFIDSLGSPIKEGKVEIRYREFMDQIDQVVSGIPMTYDSAGTTYQFLSAGMVEVKGYLNNQEVAISPQKKVDIDLVSNIPGTEYNLYKLNPVERNWDCLGKDKVVEEKVITPAPVKEILSPEQEVAELQKVPEFNKLEKKHVNILSQIKELEEAEPKAPIESTEGKPEMEMEYDLKEFPELKGLAKVKFELSENQKINASDTRVDWSDIKIEKIDDQFQITCTEIETGYSKSYFVDPTYEGQNYVEAKSKFDTTFEAYSKDLNERKTEERKVARKIKRVRNKVLGLDIRQEGIAKTYIHRIFALNSFGTFNCDSPSQVELFSSGSTKVNDITYNGKLSASENVFYVNSKYNTYLNKQLIAKKGLTFSRKGNNFLILIKGGEFGVIKPKNFKKITQKGDGAITFGSLTEIKSYSQLKKQIVLF